jgi:hypothetical protein
MAHFAQVDENWVVSQVIVVDNSILLDEQGVERDWLGEQFCQSLYGAHTKWIQTSYSGSKHKNYAGVGYTYDAERDAFIPPKPYASWLLDEDSCLWDAPVPCPDDGEPYQWDEDTGNWVAV